MADETLRREIIQPGAIEILANKASQQIATLTDVRDIRDAVERLGRVKKIVGEVTGNRTDINKIAEPMIAGIVKAGRALADMAEKGERQTGGGDKRSPSRDVTVVAPTVKELGFTRARASRWQLAAKLPDANRQSIKEKVLASDDGLWSLAEVLKAAKLWLGKEQQLDDVEPSEANIVHSDWQNWLPSQPECDLLLTDPPYSTDVENIQQFAAEWLPVALNKIKPTGRGYVCIGAYPHELLAYLTVATPEHLIFSQVLVWTYRNRVGPSPTHDYKLNWQAVLYFRGKEAPPLNCSRAVSDYPDLSEQFSVQDVSLPDPRRHEPHLCSWHAWQKPTELCERFVRHASKPGDVVIDPFAGTGSFLLAAASLGRMAFGCEKDEAMFNIAMQRGCVGE